LAKNNRQLAIGKKKKNKWQYQLAKKEKLKLKLYNQLIIFSGKTIFFTITPVENEYLFL
jgi:hypothetical protein